MATCDAIPKSDYLNNTKINVKEPSLKKMNKREPYLTFYP